ncbi:MAG: N-acetylmuramoyl-L-alanine amidase [Acidobacteriota bacterium]
MKIIVLTSVLCLLLQSCFAQSSQFKSNTDQSNQADKFKGVNKAPGFSKRVVCIDPGHPSETSAGSVVQNGTTEVHIVWVVALKLKKLLEAEGIKVVMTKQKENQQVTNKARAETANRAKADLMIRLHCDASQDNGYAIYSPDRQGTVQGVTGPAQTVIDRSRIAADFVHQGMAGVLEGVLKDGGARGDSQTFVGSKQGALTGSIFSQVPAVLVEMVVLSNPSDAEFIKTEDGQLKMAQAIAAGIKLYLQQNP